MNIKVDRKELINGLKPFKGIMSSTFDYARLIVYKTGTIYLEIHKNGRYSIRIHLLTGQAIERPDETPERVEFDIDAMLDAITAIPDSSVGLVKEYQSEPGKITYLNVKGENQCVSILSKWDTVRDSFFTYGGKDAGAPLYMDVEVMSHSLRDMLISCGNIRSNYLAHSRHWINFFDVVIHKNIMRAVSNHGSYTHRYTAGAAQQGNSAEKVSFYLNKKTALTISKVISTKAQKAHIEVYDSYIRITQFDAYKRAMDMYIKIEDRDEGINAQDILNVFDSYSGEVGATAKLKAFKLAMKSIKRCNRDVMTIRIKDGAIQIEAENGLKSTSQSCSVSISNQFGETSMLLTPLHMGVLLDIALCEDIEIGSGTVKVLDNEPMQVFTIKSENDYGKGMSILTHRAK